MKKINFNFKSIVRSKARWLLTLIAILTLGVGELWAGGFFTDGMWQVWGWKTGYKDDGWLATNMGSSTNYDIGIVDKSYTFKGLSANTWASGVNYVHVWVDWPDGTHTDHNISYSSGSSDKYWESKNLWDYSINQSIPGNFTIDLWFKIKDSGDWYDEKHLMITWTTPGFTDYPEETVGFGSKNVIGLYSETTINFKHYGTALTTTCTTNITGTNASEFVVRKIEDDKVIVAFKPSTTGTRTAKLTLTDAHGKTCEINLSGSGNALGTTTRLYFNDYTNNSDWSASSAKYRFTCQYSTGVYTNYPMTLCENTTNTYYADVELKAGNISTSIDRYNPASPYVTWNSTSSLALSASKPYAISNGKYSAYVTDHPYNDITGGTFYYDNSQSGFTNNLYLIIGMDYNIADNSSKTYSANYQLNNIGNTKLSYYTYSSTAWHDATYYAVIGASSVSGDSWGSSSLSTKGTGGYTAAYKDLFGLLSGNTYLASSPSNTGGTMTITQSPTLTTTQTFNYALSTDGGTTYDPMISGSPNTPGQLKLESYYFSNATAVTKNTDLTLSANATTYTTNKNNVAYTGTTTLTESNTRDGYSFMGWYKGNSTARTNSSTHSFTYYPQGDSTYTARYKAHRYTIAFSSNDAQYSGAPAATGSTTSISNVVYDQNVTLTANGFSRTGYTFAGWSTTADGDVAYSNSQSVSNLTATDGATVTLYAQWNEILHNVTVAYKYDETSVQDDGEVTGVGIVTTQNAVAPATIGGYSFTTWSAMPSGVTTSDELTSSTISINATADELTITANYTPTTYNGTLEGVDGSDGTYSVVYGATSLTVTSAPSKTGFHPYAYYLTYIDKTKDYTNPIAYASETSSKELVKGVSISTTDYTDANGKWKFEGEPDIFVKWEANTYIVTLHQNYGSDATSEHTIAMGDNFSRFSPTISKPTRAGYEFAGYYLSSGGDAVITANMGIPASDYFDSYANWKFDGNIDLYAHWTEVELTFDNDEGIGDGTWNTAANWSPACVPTIEHDVTISAETTISGAAVAKSVTIGGSGKVTIQPTGVLEVQGAVTNSNDSKLIINTSSSSQGALIYDISTSAPSATINMTMSHTGDDNFQYIASPVGGARVSSMFSGKGVYTYAWIEGKGWERRGYYDDFMGNEVIVINGQGSCIFSGLLYPSTGGSLAYTATPEDASAQGVNMIPNTLTAPIKIAAMSFSGSADDGVHIWENGSWHDYAPASSQAATAVIPALQGYAVLASGSGSVSFEYDAAVRNASSHNVPLGAPKRVAEGTPEYMTISVMTNDRKVDLQLSEHAQFTTAIDKGWETIYMEGDGRFGQLYALADEKMSILASPDLEGTVLGFVPGETLNYTLSFEGDGKGYYLNDIEEQQSTLIEEGNTYTFSSGNNNAARFIISRTPINKIATGVDAVSDGVKARKQMSDGVLYIIRDGKIFDARGNRVK